MQIDRHHKRTLRPSKSRPLAIQKINLKGWRYVEPSHVGNLDFFASGFGASDELLEVGRHRECPWCFFAD